MNPFSWCSPLLSSPMAPRRFLPWTDDGGVPASPQKRWQSLVLQIKARRRVRGTHGIFGFEEIGGEEFMRMFLPFFGSMVQRVVSEEVQKAVFRHFNAPAPPRLLVDQNQHPRYQLLIQNELKPVYTMMRLEGKNGAALKITIVETNQRNIIRFGHLSSVKVEIVVLHGHFNAKHEENWTTEEFNKHIAGPREKSAQLLTGSLKLQLIRGEASLDNATFTDNSSFTSTKKFRLGVRLVSASEERVLEGVTDPFRVKERRVEGFEKHHPPLLVDEVWRLEKIGANGAYHQALLKHGIDTVQKFLQAYVKDEQKLLQTFKKMSQAVWKTIIGHAMECELGDNLYSYRVEENNAVLFLDAMHQLVGVKFGDCYKPLDQLEPVEKNFVDVLKMRAYENMNGRQYDHQMVNNCPVPLYRFQTESTSLLGAVPPNQQIPNYGQCCTSLGETSNGQEIEANENFCYIQGATDASNIAVSLEMPRFLQCHTANGLQSSHQSFTNKVIPYNLEHEASLPESRISQLNISNSQRTAFGPDLTPAAVHGNILEGQVAIQLSEFGQKEPFHSSLEPFTVSISMHQFIESKLTFPLKSILYIASLFTEESQQDPIQLQPSRTNSFDPSSCDELIQSFFARPPSPRKWIKIKAALMWASLARVSASRRVLHVPPARQRLVQTIRTS